MYAVIDVGSNSVRLMLSDGVNTISKETIITRLAEGLSTTNMLKPEAVERTARAVSFFVDKAKSLGLDNPMIFATAATRQSVNGDTFVSRVKNLCGKTVDVVSGECEAELGIIGALGDKDGGVIDIGGASTEIVVRNNGKYVYCKSINVGAVRLKDLCGQNKELTDAAVYNAVEEFGKIPKTVFYAVGGTTSTIAAIMQKLNPYDATKTHGFKIYLKSVIELRDKLFSMSVQEREMITGLQKGREEIIPHGASLLCRIMQNNSLDYVIVSEKDNLEGYLNLKRGIYE